MGDQAPYTKAGLDRIFWVKPRIQDAPRVRESAKQGEFQLGVNDGFIGRGHGETHGGTFLPGETPRRE